MEFERFWRRGFCRVSLQRSAIFDGAEKAASKTGGTDDGIEQKARRCFAVRASNAYQVQLLGGVPEKIRRDRSECLARIGHSQPCHCGWHSFRRGFCSLGIAVGKGRRHFANYCCRTAVDGRRDESIAVGLLAVNGDEKRSCPNLATV